MQKIVRFDDDDPDAPSLRFLTAVIGSAESASEHPLAQAVVKYAKKVIVIFCRSSVVVAASANDVVSTREGQNRVTSRVLAYHSFSR